ncbi:DNA primase [Singulisphaera acidiphila]|uniref:DNA primase n=1 Tax=Singulisphaera acidiphila (strain ATCC BAA-1392 / DSM 18658 / VKM B-2454 / MOB10) TaxID=886293 RepID=L0D9N5_SINAD|nr:DNA primase [Singulisphaera acidiphila]AGA25942.1 DNA primase, catalytic core [Singulisphaera acidiphila DSM 18658]
MPRYSEATLAAIKQAVDIVAIVEEFLHLPLHRSGSKIKVLCPFHDDHKPSLELNSERQSFKCWSCGAGGDVFDFVKDYLRVDFPEALQMLAERAGVALESTPAGPGPKGPSKRDLLAVNEWAQRMYREALVRDAGILAYVEERGINAESVARFHLGYAPDTRDWLTSRAAKEGISIDFLERAGLVVRSKESPGLTRERFRGRLMFPIHDLRGRTLGFGGRILPQVERSLAAAGKNVAKYLNSPETPLFQKRKILYAADLALAPAREMGWAAVVEGYTDVIAAHQVGLKNVVGTLGTALGDDHVLMLRRLTDRVVLIFDGDDAGQSAADRSLELFLAHEVDVRVLTLPSKLDPCEFLLAEGADAFRALVDQAVDPMAFAIRRAESRFDLNSFEDARRAAEWVLSILARVPKSTRIGMDIKIARALDTLSQRLRVPVDVLKQSLKRLHTAAATSALVRTRAVPEVATTSAEGVPPAPPVIPIRLADLDPFGRELLEIVLNQPNVVGQLISRVAVASIRDAPLRAILQACYDLYAEGLTPTFDRVALRLDDAATRALAAGLLLPRDPAPLPDYAQPAPWEDCLAGVLGRLAQRDWQDHLQDLKDALKENDPAARPEEYQALQRELYRHHSMRPDTKKKNAS